MLCEAPGVHDVKTPQKTSSTNFKSKQLHTTIMPIVKHNRYFDAFVKDELPSSVAGKVFVITGTTSGSGFVAARTVLLKGGEVVALNRKSSRVESATARLLQGKDDGEPPPPGKLVNVECDLQDFASVRSAIGEIKTKYTRIYCLVHNAGIGIDDKGEVTVDGYNKIAQTNSLSQFLLTAELFPLLVKQAATAASDDIVEAPRIVNMSSGAKDMVGKRGIDEKLFSKLGEEEKNIGGSEMNRYAQTKLANVLFIHALHEKLRQSKNMDAQKILAISANPGAMGKDMTEEFGWLLRQMFYLFIRMTGQSNEDGAMGLLVGMMSPKAKSGVLYGPKNAGMSGPAVPNEPPKKHDHDAKSMEMLWKVSEEAVGFKFDM